MLHIGFNTNNRETGANISYVSVIGESPITTNIDLGPRQEGYVYKPHSLITIRVYLVILNKVILV
jgi:hypothetical protein